MKRLILIITLLSQYGMAARITNAAWNLNTQSVDLNLAYQGGCIVHDFSIKWEACKADGTRFGQLLDSGANDQCTDDLQQIVSLKEPADGCLAAALILKSTASKVPVVVQK